MTDLEWLKLLFAVAFGMWLFVDATFITRYFKQLIRAHFRVPFLLAATVTAICCTFEVSLYGYVVWFKPYSSGLAHFALYMIPIVFIIQAFAALFIANWVLSAHVEPTVIPPSKS